MGVIGDKAEIVENGERADLCERGESSASITFITGLIIFNII